jgi:hypothetical protein
MVDGHPGSCIDVPEMGYILKSKVVDAEYRSHMLPSNTQIQLSPAIDDSAHFQPLSQSNMIKSHEKGV